jgi:hypothetical protein
MAEYFRDVNEQAVPLFIDNIFRFAQNRSRNQKSLLSFWQVECRFIMKADENRMKAVKPWVINWFFPAGQERIPDQ